MPLGLILVEKLHDDNVPNARYCSADAELAANKHHRLREFPDDHDATYVVFVQSDSSAIVAGKFPA
ncbi:hypothetical protein BURKHO8Y_210483 [Burkholderia sp. 8Y]|nr:hypothetical protein BURKHO8Y_210483 [Burkholderia sp. 8Y]